MCFLNSPNDDQPPISPVARALEDVRAAEGARYELAVLISEDVQVRLPAGISLDQHIAKVVGNVTRARHELDRAICTLMRGERFMPFPSEPAIKHEIQNRATRNASGTSFDLLRTAMARVDAAGPDAPLPAPERQSATTYADLEAGFRSAVGA